MYNAKTIILSLLLGFLVAPPAVYAETPKSNPPDAAVTTPAPKVETVDINTADAETLMRVLDGIGEKKAIAIIEFRKKHGPFKDIIELNQVDGIGEKTIEKNRDKIVLSQPAKTENAPPPPAEAANTPPAQPAANTEAVPDNNSPTPVK